MEHTPQIALFAGARDYEFARRLSAALAAHGYTSFLTSDLPPTGAHPFWEQEVAAAERADAVIALWYSSPWLERLVQRFETLAEQTGAQRLILVALHPDDPPPLTRWTIAAETRTPEELADYLARDVLPAALGASAPPAEASVQPPADAWPREEEQAAPPVETPQDAQPKAGEDAPAGAMPSPPPPRPAPAPAPIAPPAPGYYGAPFPYAPPASQSAPPPPAPGGAPRGGPAGLGTADRRRQGIDEGASAQPLQFSAFHPAEIATVSPTTLLLYTHVADALAQIEADAATFTELGSAPVRASGVSAQRVRQGVELTVEPHMDGVTFSPPSESFIWRGGWRRSLFRLTADARLAGTSQAGWIDIYAEGKAPIATIDLTFTCHAAIPMALTSAPKGMAVTANVYDTVFISYSHRDEEAMRQARSVYDQLGVTVYVDERLEAGDNFDRTLAQMIDASNVFHLLWSSHAATSDYVRKEWSQALASNKGARFIRPWFWRKPLTPPPPEFEARKISFKFEPLKRRLFNPATWW